MLIGLFFLIDGYGKIPQIIPSETGKEKFENEKAKVHEPFVQYEGNYGFRTHYYVFHWRVECDVCINFMFMCMRILLFVCHVHM